jgi:hypothetical protein
MNILNDSKIKPFQEKMAKKIQSHYCSGSIGIAHLNKNPKI